MKLYFTKHIAVEGEVKEGDNAYFAGDKLIVLNGGFTTDLAKVANKYDGKRAKLFLCSRDIQVGEWGRANDRLDEAIQFKQVAKHDTSFAEFITQSMEFVYHDLRDVFKIIGEISPEATWVKEGDEFDENDVRKAVDIELYYADASEQWQYYTQFLQVEKTYECKKDKGYHESITEERIEIKGQCGHFH